MVSLLTSRVGCVMTNLRGSEASAAAATSGYDEYDTGQAARLTAEQLLDGLNSPQREAVLHEGGPVL